MKNILIQLTKFLIRVRKLHNEKIKESTSFKYCEDCSHCVEVWINNNEYHKCNRMSGGVSKRDVSSFEYCSILRESYCGEKAKYFEKKHITDLV